MANNKVVYGNTTIMDITDTTAEASDVASGEVFYSRDGVRRVGTGDYMSKVANPTADDVLVTDASGQAMDSGVSIDDLATETYVDGKFTVINWASTDYATIRGLAESRVPFWVIDPSLPISDPTVKAFHATQVTLQTTSVSFKVLAAYTHYGYTVTASDKSRSVGETYASNAYATDSAYGLVKTNSAKSITLNADGQLEVGGRLGQFPDGGVYYPDTIEPTEVKASTFMMTDGAKYLSLGGRTFGIMAGAGITCKSASAGATEYRVSNTQANRFALFSAKGGRAAIDQTDAINNGTALITDVSFANGNPISAYFGPTESTNDIIITLERTVNPSAATTKLRVYGTSTSSDVIVVGQGCGASGGKAISLGQSCYAGGSQCIAFGNSSLSLANNSVAFGHTNLVNKQFCFCAGQGHDFTNGSNGAGAVGICSEISSDTAFAVGNGVFASNGNITRSNALEVKTDGSIVLKSPNGTRYKVSVTDAGSLTVVAV